MKTFQNIVRYTLPAMVVSLGMGTAALAQTTMAPATTPSSTAAPKMNAAAPGAPASTMKPSAMKSTSMASGAKLSSSAEFKSVDLAQAHCPGDTVVWSTLSKTHSFHMASSKYYGKTKHGAYVCEKDATAAGYHPSKS
jgi:hypothetical protein